MKKRIILYVIGGILLAVGLAYWLILGQYNATMYSYANDWIKEEFIYNNKVTGASYKNKDYNPELECDDENWVDKYYYYDEKPNTRTFIITDEKMFNEIFTENSIDINFEKEMVVLYIESDVCPRDCYLLSISNNNGKLTFKYMHKFSTGNDTVQSYPRCIAVKMKKMDITSVEFIDVY